MNIHSLLNHPPTPSSINSVYYSQSTSPSSNRTPTPSAGHRVQTTSKVSKTAKNNSKISKHMASTGTTIQYVRFDKPCTLDNPPNYPAYEISERPASLTRAEREELSAQQKPFHISVYPHPAEGQPSLIGDYPKTVPYGGKPGAYGKQKRTGLHLFGYTFTVLQGPKKGEILQVLWDYKTGHVRLTAMFRALGHQKTEPKNAIDVNTWGTTDDKKLETVCYSVTGGNLGTQGYFMPYHCARELCRTFCWDIRWALTPVFGPTFAKECLTPDNPRYGKYQISWSTFSHALQEHNAIVMAVNNVSEPMAGIGPKRELSHLSSSDHSSRATLRTQPTRTRRSSYRLSSVSSEADDTSTTMSSPPVSPKTIPASRRGWTPVNAAQPTIRSEAPCLPVAPPVTNSRRRPVPSDFSEDDSAVKRARFKHTEEKPKKNPKRVRKVVKKVASPEPEEDEDSDASFVPGLTNKEISEDLKKYKAARALLDFYHGNTFDHQKRK
ncbi:hypothetical protein MBLNU457_4407t1 [Dothideomycetes sp. NU457]